MGVLRAIPVALDGFQGLPPTLKNDHNFRPDLLLAFDLLLLVATRRPICAAHARHRGAFDYLYLPMDFERGQNRGFAFVNFITPRGVPNFYEEFHGHPLTESSANRRVEIIFADVQGKEENLRESARYRPACFVSDGSHRREM